MICEKCMIVDVETINFFKQYNETGNIVLD